MNRRKTELMEDVRRRTDNVKSKMDGAQGRRKTRVVADTSKSIDTSRRLIKGTHRWVV